MTLLDVETDYDKIVIDWLTGCLLDWSIDRLVDYLIE